MAARPDGECAPECAHAVLLAGGPPSAAGCLPRVLAGELPGVSLDDSVVVSRRRVVGGVVGEAGKVGRPARVSIAPPAANPGPGGPSSWCRNPAGRASPSPVHGPDNHASRTSSGRPASQPRPRRRRFRAVPRLGLHRRVHQVVQALVTAVIVVMPLAGSSDGTAAAGWLIYFTFPPPRKYVSLTLSSTSDSLRRSSAHVDN
jgi:hypothetical protein